MPLSPASILRRAAILALPFLGALGSGPLQAKPRITLQLPDGFLCPILGNHAFLAVRAEGSGTLRYTWFKNGVELAGETGRDLFLPAVELWHSGKYSVAVTDDEGTCHSVQTHLMPVPRDYQPEILREILAAHHHQAACEEGSLVLKRGVGAGAGALKPAALGTLPQGRAAGAAKPDPKPAISPLAKGPQVARWQADFVEYGAAPRLMLEDLALDSDGEEEPN